MDAEGRFEFSALPPGDYRLGIATRRESNYGFRMFADVTLRPGETEREVSLRYREEPAGTIVVTVTDSEGEPVSGASVSLVRASTGAEARLKADRAGVFERELHPDRFHITVRCEGYRPVVFEE